MNRLRLLKVCNHTYSRREARFSPDSSGYPADDNGDADCGWEGCRGNSNATSYFSPHAIG